MSFLSPIDYSKGPGHSLVLGAILLAVALGMLVVAIGIAGNLTGFPILDPIAVAFVGLAMVMMGRAFGWDAVQSRTNTKSAPERGET